MPRQPYPTSVPNHPPPPPPRRGGLEKAHRRLARTSCSPQRGAIGAKSDMEVGSPGCYEMGRARE
eukprot:scaffold238112_cov30-Tisochrysis_lutea.AAC.2